MPSKVKYFYELTVSSSPHVHGPNRTGRLMLDVILALLPALVAGKWTAFRALWTRGGS